jgi:hypothetical protein
MSTVSRATAPCTSATIWRPASEPVKRNGSTAKSA